MEVVESECWLLWRRHMMWGELTWDWTMACASSPLKHSWKSGCVAHPHGNPAVGFHPVWRIFTFSGSGCPTFRRQVLWLLILYVNWWYIGRAKSCLALDAAKLIPKLNQKKIIDLLHIEERFVTLCRLHGFHTSHSYCPISACVALMMLRHRMPLRASFRMQYFFWSVNSLPSLNHLPNPKADVFYALNDQSNHTANTGYICGTWFVVKEW